MTIGVIAKLAKIADKLLKLPTTAGSSTIGHDGPESTVQVDLRDVNWPNANIWAMGMMGKKKKP